MASEDPVHHNDDDAQDDEVESQQMSLTDHLDELRARLIYAIVAVGAIAVLAYIFKEPLLQLLLGPFQSAMDTTSPIEPNALDRILAMFKEMLVDYGVEQGRDKQTLSRNAALMIDQLRERLLPTGLVFLHPAEAFFSYLKLAALTGLIVGMPAVIYQLWKFVMPALYRNERSYLVSFLASGSTLFYIGVAFSFVVILPLGMEFLVGIGRPLISPMFSVGNYVSFSMLFMLVFGLAFELPLAMFFLVKMGLVEHGTFVRQWRIVVVVGFGVGAFFTPPDLFTQLAMALSIVVLYIVGLGLTYFASRAREQAESDEND
ncbi:MAG: twin-arginine translocase subunit TatC [Candidatus Bipolaricaulia bacterium]